MTPDDFWTRWDEVDALLEQALDRPPEERRPFVRAACGDDHALRDMVEGLLDADEGDAPAPPGEVVRAALADRRGEAHAEALVGSMAGAYRLVRVIGRGGMGTVFLGERADGAFERHVAVKVLHRGLAEGAAWDRFRRERQILASLQHPAIAQMLDGGVTEAGRPFLVMEHVDGVAIDAHVRSRRLSVDERIRLVIRVADAVDHAHRHLVVHRDLKPSNILVTGEGEVKLLDFGIAKLLEPDAAEPAVTRAEARFVTPEYAAPEQLLGEPVSTQTDVFTLAALLYELLTGSRPYERRPDGSVLERMIRGDEPTAPSAVVSDGGGVVPGLEGAALRRRLGGDLDAILLRALQTRPEARYASVAAFREDLERHLAGAPVAARGDARWYRFRRFVRRHRGPLLVAGGVFLLVAGSAVGLAVQRAAVVDAAERARREAATAREVTAFLVDLFEAGDPEAVRSDSLTVSALLDRGTARIDSLADHPAVQAELLETLGRVQARIGDYDAAVPLLERAVEARQGLNAPDSVQARSLVSLGDAHRGSRFWTAAVDAYRRALDVAGVPPSRARAEALVGLANAEIFLEQLDSAQLHLEAAVALERTLGSDAVDSRGSLAALLRRRGDLEGAARIYTDLIGEERLDPSRGAVDFATLLNNLAVVRRMQERYDEAYPLYREALDSARAVLGPGHPQALMLAGNLATATMHLGRADETLTLYRERVAAAAEAWPDGHWQRAEVLWNLGAALVDHDRFDEAIPPLSEALDMGIAELGSRHSWNAIYRGWLALAAARTGRADAADQLFGWSFEGVEGYEGLLEDANMVNRVTILAEALERKGLADEAARYRAALAGGP